MLDLTPNSFRQQIPVTEAILARLTVYSALLSKWQRRINLIGSGTLQDVWRRHILDSAQLHRLLPDRCRVIDLGSGAGFPGLVLAIMGGCEVHLIESDGRKAVFLREVARQTATVVHIHHARIEKVAPVAAEVVTSRACAPLPQLLEYAEPFLKDGGVGLFLKGQNVDGELTEAHKMWMMSADKLPSASDRGGVILRLEGIRRRHHGC